MRDHGAEPSNRQRIVRDIDDGQRAAALLEGLSAQAATLSALEDAEEAEELALAEIARIPWSDRARALAGSGIPITVELPDRVRIEGAVEVVLSDGIVLGELDTATGAAWAVRAAAVCSISGLGQRTRSAGTVAGRLSLTTILREWGREASTVSVLGDSGRSEGTLVRIGADHLDLAEHDRENPRVVRVIRTLPLSRVWAIRRWP